MPLNVRHPVRRQSGFPAPFIGSRLACYKMLSELLGSARKRFELHGGSGTLGERLDRGSFILMDIEHAGQFGDFQQIKDLARRL